jgi:hypothetical protein
MRGTNKRGTNQQRRRGAGPHHTQNGPKQPGFFLSLRFFFRSINILSPIIGFNTIPTTQQPHPCPATKEDPLPSKKTMPRNQHGHQHHNCCDENERAREQCEQDDVREDGTNTREDRNDKDGARIGTFFTNNDCSCHLVII